MEKSSKRGSFFDTNLQTVIPDVVQEANDDNNTKFTDFHDKLKIMFSDISDSSIHQLFSMFSDSANYLQDSINAYLDDPSKFTNRDREDIKEVEQVNKLHQDFSEKPYCSIRYEYKSRKRGIDSFLQNDSLGYVKKVRTKKATDSGKSSFPSDQNKANVNTLTSKNLSSNIPENTFWKKYIGTFNIPCWCTRTLYGLSSIYTNNRLTFGKPSGADVVYVYHQPQNSSYKRELGRVNELTADILSPLVADGVIKFESRLFFVEGTKLGAGDTFIIRTDCFLSEKVFTKDISDDSEASFDLDQLKVIKNSDGKIQAGTRLKNAMIKLFSLLDLKCTQILNKKDISEPHIDSDESSTYPVLIENDELELGVEETEENDTKLSINQIKDLQEYRNLELRPYQKLALSWMLQREKEYDAIGINNEDLDTEVRDFVIKQLQSTENSINPLWREYSWPEIPSRINHTQLPEDCSDTFYFNLYKGNCSLFKPLIKSTCKGGILADEMGLGKTITTLSLVMTYPEDLKYKALPVNSVERSPDYAFCTTLIIVPMALLNQWEREFQKVTQDSSGGKCFVYYGSESSKSLKNRLLGPSPPTIVLTTYGMVQSDWIRTSRSDNETGLFSIKFLRIILDEGHNIRNRTTKTAKAIYDLNADRRWILTGTPIINKLEDIFSLLHFLQLKPWSYHTLWKHCISIPFESGKDVDVASDLLKSILDPILLRRTKNQKDSNGKLLVTLPPKEVVIERISFNQKEQVVYNWLKEKAVNSFNENFKSGMIFKNYSSILTQLLRLRQVCCHVDLIKTTKTEELKDYAPEAEITEVLKKSKSLANSDDDDEMLALVKKIESNELKQRIPLDEIRALKEKIYEKYPTFDDQECAICTEQINVNTCVITECLHCFCYPCLTEHIDFQLKKESDSHSNRSSVETDDVSQNHCDEVFCPLCREKVNRNRMLRTAEKSGSPTQSAGLDCRETLQTQISDETRNYYVRPFLPNHQSSKINTLLMHLDKIRFESPGEHVVIFSQFTSFLDIIEQELANYKAEFNVFKFDGRLKLEQRQTVLNAFEMDVPSVNKKISVLLLSLKAGGVGLNLTVASKAFLMDPHWNSATESQAIDRIHRVGQSKDVRVVRFIMRDSIEERMLQIQARKNQLGDAMTLTDEERKKRNIEELQSIFAD
ncbi:hypothetical protein CANINC_002735 [Pichia inconspicua]|uniref:DNA repair protein RAD5 n=1 Tax=Pichia inconspicua TaxID=52247 RepID=A0A4T0X1T0_9ASCO|nr:hypothetical protein CANINC_002735 [[Candida] inconspicua]